MQRKTLPSGKKPLLTGLAALLALGTCGYSHLPQHAHLPPQMREIDSLNRKARPHFDRARENIPGVTADLANYRSMIKICYLQSIDKITGANRAREYLHSVLRDRIIIPCQRGAQVYGCDIDPSGFQHHFMALNGDAALSTAFSAGGLMLEMAFLKSTIKTISSIMAPISSRLAAAYGSGAVCAAADGPIPVGDVLALSLATGGSVLCAYDLWHVRTALAESLTAMLEQLIDECEAGCRKAVMG